MVTALQLNILGCKMHTISNKQNHNYVKKVILEYDSKLPSQTKDSVKTVLSLQTDRLRKNAAEQGRFGRSDLKAGRSKRILGDSSPWVCPCSCMSYVNRCTEGFCLGLSFHRCLYSGHPWMTET